MTEEQLIAAGWTRRNMGQSVVYTREGEWIDIEQSGSGLYEIHIASYIGRSIFCAGEDFASALATLGSCDWDHPQTVAQYCGVAP